MNREILRIKDIIDQQIIHKEMEGAIRRQAKAAEDKEYEKKLEEQKIQKENNRNILIESGVVDFFEELVTEGVVKLSDKPVNRFVAKKNHFGRVEGYDKVEIQPYIPAITQWNEDCSRFSILFNRVDPWDSLYGFQNSYSYITAAIQEDNSIALVETYYEVENSKRIIKERMIPMDRGNMADLVSKRITGVGINELPAVRN